jgi:hypothetical protein
LDKVVHPLVYRFCKSLDHGGRDAANAAAWQEPRCCLCVAEGAESIPAFFNPTRYRRRDWNFRLQKPACPVINERLVKFCCVREGSK